VRTIVCCLHDSGGEVFPFHSVPDASAYGYKIAHPQKIIAFTAFAVFAATFDLFTTQGTETLRIDKSLYVFHGKQTHYQNEHFAKDPLKRLRLLWLRINRTVTMSLAVPYPSASGP